MLILKKGSHLKAWGRGFILGANGKARDTDSRGEGRREVRRGEGRGGEVLG